jgi:NAD(P)-dependent dehydrogenase (short-subunit alcohol dehydrogenase family)
MCAEVSPETMEELAREGLVGRNGTPEDVAQSFLYLADASFVTGQVLPVNGGLVL